MKTKYPKILILIFAIIFAWQLYNKYDKYRLEKQKIESNYLHITGVIKRASPSGIRNNRSTILQVEYELNNDKKLGTLRKSGYQEGRYRVGDSVKIYVNANDETDIK